MLTRYVKSLGGASLAVHPLFDDRGEHALKGIAEPVRLYAVRTPD